MALEKSGKLKGSWHYTKGCCQHFWVSTKHIKHWAYRYINSKDKSGLVFRERDGGEASMGHILHVKIGLLIDSLKCSVNSLYILFPGRNPKHFLNFGWFVFSRVQSCNIV